MECSSHLQSVSAGGFKLFEIWWILFRVMLNVLLLHEDTSRTVKSEACWGEGFSWELDFLSMPIWHLLQIFPSLKLIYTSVEDVWHHHKDVASSLIAANIDAGGTYHGCFSRGHLWKYETCIPQGTRKYVCVFVKFLFLCFGLSDALSFHWHELLILTTVLS
jgi:hypothetical protein